MHLNVIQFKREILNTIPARRIENTEQKVYLTIQNDVKILPWETRAVDTLTIVEIPRGHFGRTHIKQSLAEIRLNIEGGIVNAGHNGIIQLILFNRDPRKTIHLYKENHIAELVIQPLPQEEVPRSMSINAVITKKITEIKHDQLKIEKTSYKIGPQLTGEQAERIHKLLKDNSDILATSFEEIRVHEPIYKHHIDTRDHKPIKQRPRQVPLQHRE